MIAALAASVLFATSITCGHRATKLIGGASANFWRLVIATILLGIWSFSFGIGIGGPIWLISTLLMCAWLAWFGFAALRPASSPNSPKTV